MFIGLKKNTKKTKIIVWTNFIINFILNFLIKTINKQLNKLFKFSLMIKNNLIKIRFNKVKIKLRRKIKMKKARTMSTDLL